MSATFEVREGENIHELQVFPAGMFESAEQASEFSDSLGLWKKVESPAVLQVTESIWIPDGTVLLLTDFPSGETLGAWLTENDRMTVPAALRLGIRVLGGLIEAHEVGLIHGDLKPFNLHLENGDPDTAVIVDGGITTCLWSAKHLGDKTALIGTPIYAPAEQFGGDSPDVRSDIYNLATVLFETIAGVVPWPGQSFLQIFQAKLEKTPPRISERAPDVEIDREVEDAILGGLGADKRDRYDSAEEFRDALLAVVG